MTAALVLAQQLLDCFRTALLAGPNPPPISKIMLRAGAEVTPLLGTLTDECCTGLGWVRVARVDGVRQLGDRLNVSCFEQERELTLELGVARCAPTAPVSTVPTLEQWEAAALQQDADFAAMEAAVCCAFREADNVDAEEVTIGAWNPFGVDGNCIGGTMEVRIRMSACC